MFEAAKARQAALAEKKRIEEEAKATPSLNWVLVGDAGWALCGNVTRKRRWAVNDPRRQGGIIIQRVRRIFSVKRWNAVASDWEDMTLSDIDRYVVDRNASPCAQINEYWEAWDVDEKGRVEFGGDDTFAVGSIIPNPNHNGLTHADVRNTTKGDITIIGEARFIPGVRRGTIGTFRPQNPHPAGIIPSTDADPGYSGGYEAPVYTLKVEWDSSKPNCDSVVVQGR